MNKVFWSIELDYKEAREQLERECYEARTLFDALMTGANSIRLDGRYIGYVMEDGTLDITEEPFCRMTDKMLGEIRVEFDQLDRDEDGFTIALFHIDTKIEKSKWDKRGYEVSIGWLKEKEEC